MFRRALLEFVWVAVPKIIAGALTVGLSAWLVRSLGVEDYGRYSLCLASIIIGDALIGAPLDLAVLRLAPRLRATSETASLSIERAASQLKIVLGLGVLVATVPGSAVISQLVFREPGQWPLVVGVFVALLSMLLFRSVLVHAQVRLRFDRYGFLESIHLITKFGGIAALLTLAEATPLKILIFFAAGPFAAFTCSVAFTDARNLLIPEFSGTKIRELVHYVKWYAVSGGAGALIDRIDVFMLMFYATLSHVGIFSGGYVFAVIPSVIAGFLATVFAPRIVPLYDAGTLRRTYLGVQGLLLAVAGVVQTAALWHGGPLLEIILPPAYHDSIQVVLILLPGTLLSAATIPLALSIVMFFRRRYIVMMNLISLPILLPAYYYAIAWSGAAGAAYVTGVSLLLRSALVQLTAWRLTNRAT